MRIFLHDAVARARNPKIVFRVHRAAVGSVWRRVRRRQRNSRRSRRDRTRSPPAPDARRPGRCPSNRGGSRTNTWSRESMHTPPMPPVTHRFGKGLGQAGSTSNLGALPCACRARRTTCRKAMANPANIAARRTKLIFFFISVPFREIQFAMPFSGIFHFVPLLAGLSRPGRDRSQMIAAFSAGRVAASALNEEIREEHSP